MMKPILLEMKYEFLSLLRMPRYSVMTIAFPAMFYVFFGIFIQNGKLGNVSAAAYLLTTMGTLGIMFSSMMALGAGIASERGLGWLEVKRASPMPALGWFAAKLSAAVLFGLIVTGVLFGLGAAFGGVRMAVAQWVELAGGLALGAIPFSTLGFVLGYLATPNSAPAMVNIVAMPMAFLSGLWVPAEFLPKALQNLAPFLPSYHLAQMGQVIVGVAGRGPVLPHVWALAGFTAVFTVAGWLVWRREESRVHG